MSYVAYWEYYQHSQRPSQYRIITNARPEQMSPMLAYNGNFHIVYEGENPQKAIDAINNSVETDSSGFLRFKTDENGNVIKFTD